ncbi:MAG: RsmD family RNA methyltransferase [Candidatus Woesearchaeota archaeon]|jgi:putative methylase
MSKQNLAVELSKFKVFDDAKQKLEQYSTDSEIAADLLWSAYMQNWIKDKIIVDLGAGTGILGLGCLLLGAKRVIFVEKDKDSIKILNENLTMLKEEFDVSEDISIECIDISEISKDSFENIDLVIQNPPFGTQEKNVDALFLEKAMLIANKIITMHKTVTKPFIKTLIESNEFKEFRVFDYNYPLKMTLAHHKKSIEHIKVSAWFLVKINA